MNEQMEREIWQDGLMDGSRTRGRSLEREGFLELGDNEAGKRAQPWDLLLHSRHWSYPSLLPALSSLTPMVTER